MSDKVFWIIELAIKSGELDNFKALMKEMVEFMQANEPNTINYEWFISEDNKTCHIYEGFTDSAAVMVHLGNFGKKFGKQFMATTKTTRLTLYGNASDDVKKALSVMSPTHLTFIGGFTR